MLRVKVNIENEKIDLTTKEKLEEIKVGFSNQCNKYGIQSEW